MWSTVGNLVKNTKARRLKSCFKRRYKIVTFDWRSNWCKTKTWVNATRSNRIWKYLQWKWRGKTVGEDKLIMCFTENTLTIILINQLPWMQYRTSFAFCAYHSVNQCIFYSKQAHTQTSLIQSWSWFILKKRIWINY